MIRSLFEKGEFAIQNEPICRQLTNLLNNLRMILAIIIRPSTAPNNRHIIKILDYAGPRAVEFSLLSLCWCFHVSNCAIFA